MWFWMRDSYSPLSLPCYRNLPMVLVCASNRFLTWLSERDAASTESDTAPSNIRTPPIFDCKGVNYSCSPSYRIPWSPLYRTLNATPTPHSLLLAIAATSPAQRVPCLQRFNVHLQIIHFIVFSTSTTLLKKPHSNMFQLSYIRGNMRR